MTGFGGARDAGTATSQPRQLPLVLKRKLRTKLLIRCIEPTQNAEMKGAKTHVDNVFLDELQFTRLFFLLFPNCLSLSGRCCWVHSTCASRQIQWASWVLSGSQDEARNTSLR